MGQAAMKRGLEPMETNPIPHENRCFLSLTGDLKKEDAFHRRSPGRRIAGRKDAKDPPGILVWNLLKFGKIPCWYHFLLMRMSGLGFPLSIYRQMMLIHCPAHFFRRA